MGFRSLLLNILLSPAVLQGFFWMFGSFLLAKPGQVCCSLPANPQYVSASTSLIRPWTSLSSSKLLEGFAWALWLVVPCQGMLDLPLPLAPLLQLLWGALAFGKLSRKLCSLNTLRVLRFIMSKSILISKMSSRCMFCSGFGFRLLDLVGYGKVREQVCS